MRKTIVSALLALIMLLLPLVSCAEEAPKDALLFIHTIKANEEELSAVLTDLGVQVDEQLLTGLTKLINSFSTHFVYQENGIYSSFLLDDEVMGEFTYIISGMELHVQSNLLPGIIFREQADAADLTRMQSLMDEVQTYDWNSLFRELKETTVAWIEGSSGSAVTGSFRGDAYQGGTKQVSFTLDKRDVAAWMIALLEKCAAPIQMLRNLDCDPNVVRADIYDSILRWAQNNDLLLEGCYVSNDADEPVGLSATLYRGESQIMTLSVGFQGENGLRIVQGFGAYDDVYYNDILISISSGQETADINVRFDEYKDPDRLGFAVISQEEPAVSITEKMHLSGGINDRMLACAKETTVTVPGYTLRMESQTQADRQEMTMSGEKRLYWSDANTPFLVTYAKMEPSQRVSLQDADDAVIIDIETISQNSDRIEEAYTSGSSALAAKLFKKLPPELIVYLINWSWDMSVPNMTD